MCVCVILKDKLNYCEYNYSVYNLSVYYIIYTMFRYFI